MASKSSQPDNRTRVDRFLDRLKNNRVVAVIIVLGIGLGALAGLSDSLKKLSDVLPSFSSADVSGEWHSAPTQFYPIGAEIMVLRLKESVGTQLMGELEFRTPQGQLRSNSYDVLDGKREGRKVAFAFSSGAVRHASASDKPVVLRETVTGELVGDELRLVYQREGHTGVPVTVRRVQEKSVARPNTRHLMIRITRSMMTGRIDLARRRRSGQLLIFRLTPRGLRRPRRHTTRSCRIPSSTRSWNTFLC